MTAKQPKPIPSFRRHKASGQGLVELNGQRIYLGRFDRPETQQRYHRLIAEWIANGRQLPIDPHDITITELCAQFWRHAEAHYRKPSGEHTTTLDHYRQALRPLKELYGSTSAAHFGPRALQALRQRMVDVGLARTHINRQVGRLRSVFKWGVAQELVPASVHHALSALTGLQAGRTSARETEPVRPVADSHIKAVKPHVSRQVAAMNDVQRLTGMRPGEVVMMRGCDLNTVGRVWTYSPAIHKAQHHGHERTIYIGPRAQAMLREFLKPNLSAYLFSPAEAEAERHKEQHRHRKTAMSCGNVPGSNRKQHPAHQPGERYAVGSFRRAIERACDAAFPPPDTIRNEQDSKVKRAKLAEWRQAHRWTPHRLRHNAATFLRREYGIDLAQTILGHRLGSTITEVYAEANVAKAIDVMGKVG